MIRHPAYPVEPWAVRETALDFDVLAQSESVFALANGHIGLRANLDEGEPHGLPGSYLNSVYEVRPLPYAEGGYAYPPAGQTIINVTNGKLIRLLVDDEPFDVRYGTLRSHERLLDLRDGVLKRNVTWTSPAGRTIEVRSTRLVSFRYRSVVAISYEVRPVDGPAQVVLQSELVANESQPIMSDDPRAAAALEAPLISERHLTDRTRGLLIHRTRGSGLRVAAGMEHIFEWSGGRTEWSDDGVVHGSTGLLMDSSGTADLARVTATVPLQAGEWLRVVKFVAYGWSHERSLPAVQAQIHAALTAARAVGWTGLLAAQREYLDDFWARADVEVDGDDEVQQAVRFGLFHVLQASARAERRAIPAKGLTGPGYDGHAFWDTESFVLPVLTYTSPDAASDALRWRHSTIPIAEERAKQLHLRGAAFAWRTISGVECSAYWPAGTSAFHVNADIADAMIRQVAATGDQELEREIGVDLLVSTARLWMSFGVTDANGQFRLDGVTGPDEYSAIADNNVYTNLMAQRNLNGAADAVHRHPDKATELQVTTDEVADWRAAATAMTVLYDEDLAIHPQAEQFCAHAVWDFDGTPQEKYPLLLHYPYGDLYRKQVVKQADLVLAMFLCGDAFTMEQKVRNFNYYEALTVRDSSLSACTQAIMAAEVGQLDLAYDYLGEAALMDLSNLEHNTRDGVHVASLAGSWLALVAGFGGMRDHDGTLSFAPRLPRALRQLAFRILWRGQSLRVTVTPTEASYSVAEGMPLEFVHYGQKVRVEPGTAVTRPIPPVEAGPPPSQPAGRAPERRGVAPGPAANEINATDAAGMDAMRGKVAS